MQAMVQQEKSLTSHHLPDLPQCHLLNSESTLSSDDALDALHAVALEILSSALLIGCIMA